MRRRFSLVLRYLFLCLIALPLSMIAADTIQLKSGEKIEGRVTQSDDENVTIQVQFSPSIVDERIIARADIAHLAVESGDEAAFAKIREIEPPDTLLSPKPCQKLIDEKLEPFLKQFPDSPRVADVRAMIKSIRVDIARLKAGDIKASGTWHDQASFQAEKYQIEATTVFENMRQNFDAGDFGSALNDFELLQRKYPQSLAYAESVPVALNAVQKLLQQLNLFIRDFPLTKARRQAALDRTPIEQQPPIRKAMADEDARASAVSARAQKENRKFFAIYPFDEKGVLAMHKAARQIETQLATIDQKKLARSVQLVRRADQELAEHQLAAVATSLGQLRAVWPQYEGLSRIEQKMKAALAADQASAEALEKKDLPPEGRATPLL